MTLDRVVMIAKQFGPDVINSVGVTQPQQVMLEVRFIEVQRNASRELGVNWQFFGNTTKRRRRHRYAAFEQHAVWLGAFDAARQRLRSRQPHSRAEDRGVARRLAEPNLVALSGDTASFLAGGEFPFPVAGALNTVTIEFKKFGVGLAFTPTVLANGLINMKIEPEVSQIDPTNVISIGGIQIPI